MEFIVKNLLLLSLVFLGVLPLTACQDSQALIEKGKLLAESSVEIFCTDGTNQVPFNAKSIDHSKFSKTVAMNWMMSGDLTKAGAIAAVKTAAQKYPLQCGDNSSTVYNKLQIGIPSSKDGLVKEAVVAYLKTKNVELPFTVGAIQKVGENYNIVDSATDINKVEPPSSSGVKTPTSGTIPNGNIEIK